ncbi:MAG: molybdenum cofactor guanylyltransferase [Chloroflexota bacterium]
MLDDVTAIVLAGGRSSRFGSDKLAFEIDGRTMLERAVAAVTAVTSRVVLVLAPGVEMPATLDATNVTVVHDPTAFEGPLAGLAAALASIDTPVALVVAGDMPRMVPAVLQRLASTVETERPAVNLEVPRRMQPLPMAISVEAVRPVAAALLERGERSLRALLTELGAASIPAPVWLSLDPAGATIQDVNRPGDLRV